MVERKVGRRVSAESSAAIGWIVTYCMDMMRHADRPRARDASQAALQMAWDDATGTVRNAAATHYLRLHPHVVAQIPVAAQHIHDDHLYA